MLLRLVLLAEHSLGGAVWVLYLAPSWAHCHVSSLDNGMSMFRDVRSLAIDRPKG